jgi:hypothetical protein
VWIAAPIALAALLAVALVGRRWFRRSTQRVEPTPAEGPPPPAEWQVRHHGWFNRMHFPPKGFYAELWRDPREEPSFPAMAEKYGDETGASEVGRLQTKLPDEVLTAAAGVLYTLGRIEAILAELQDYVDEHVEPWREGEPWPEYGHGVAHPLVVEASFEYANFLSWLRAIEERLDRPYLPRSKAREGLLPALADRPLRGRVDKLVEQFRETTVERMLANYQLHAAAAAQPFGGADLSPDNRVTMPIPDKPSERIASRWHLSYDEERDLLTAARETARAVEAFVDELVEAFEDEFRAVTEEREARTT